MILAFETARQLGVRSIFAEEVKTADGATTREFRRGFTIERGERVLLVDDILTTGGSLLAMLPAVEAMGGEVIECAVLVDRSGGRQTLTSPTTGRVYPLRSLWQLDLPTYEAGRRDVPAVRRRHAAPRSREHRRRAERVRRRSVVVGAGLVIALVAAPRSSRDARPAAAPDRDRRRDRGRLDEPHEREGLHDPDPGRPHREVHARPARERVAVRAGPPQRACRDGSSGARDLSATRTASGSSSGSRTPSPRHRSPSPS